MICRNCNSTKLSLVIDLGHQPPSNSYIEKENLNSPEIYYPLRVKVCEKCFLVQTEDFTGRETFFSDDYAYFSSTSQSWLAHAKTYVGEMIERYSIKKTNFVVEVASNDGYLLKNFVERQIPCLGIEPTGSTASAAQKIGVETIEEFFGCETASKIVSRYSKADLIICNNVYAHVPDINDFTAGLKILLNDEGVITIEFPHLLNLMNLKQFDTIYHEHYSYLSLRIVREIFKKHGLRVFDVEMLETHGGSLRIHGCNKDAMYVESSNVERILNLESEGDLNDTKRLVKLKNDATAIKIKFLEFLLDAKRNNKKVCAYGAAAKANTIMNFSGIKKDLLNFVADAAASKIGKFMPGSQIPILPPSAVTEFEPDFLIIFPWNIADEIKGQFDELAQAGCKFVVCIPDLKII